VPFSVLISQNIFVNVECDYDAMKSYSAGEKKFKTELKLDNYIDSLKIFDGKYGKNKEIPEEIKKLVLVTLSFYPELSSTNISFGYNPIKQTMNARPLVGNLFCSKKERKYCILINNNKGKNKGLPIETLSFNIIVGWLGHELAHIVAYEKMTNWQTISFASKYLLSSKYNRTVERYTDYTTIEHGLAYPLYDGVEYLLNDSSVTDEYKQKIRDNYLALEEIEFLWKQINNTLETKQEPVIRNTQLRP